MVGKRRSRGTDVACTFTLPTRSPQVCILVVDDEPAFCAVVCEILQLAGFDVHQAINAQSALNVLQEIRPDLILTDVMMPGIDGLSFIRLLRKEPHCKDIPTIVVSALGSPDDQRAAEEAGADGFLAKPFTMIELRDMIERFLPVH